MPSKRPAGDDLRTQKAREEMIQGPSAVDLDVHDFSVRAVGLPLFRRMEDGILSQVLRLVVQAESAAGDVTFTVSDGDTTLARARVRIDDGRTLVHLFVPEVYEPRTFGLRVEARGGEPFEAGVEIRPQRKWSVFLVHHSHLDIGYTDTQGSVRQHHLQYLDSVLDLVSATDDWPEDAKFRWNVEATWPLLHWIKNRPERDRSRFFDRVREGRIEICALPFSMHTEAYSIDELARQIRFADELRERGSFCSVEHPLVDVVALMSSRRGHDLTVMLQSLSSENEEVCVSFGLLGVARAWVGSHLEKNLEEARVDGEKVRFVVPAGSLVSLAVDLERGR